MFVRAAWAEAGVCNPSLSLLLFFGQLVPGLAFGSPSGWLCPSHGPPIVAPKDTPGSLAPSGPELWNQRFLQGALMPLAGEGSSELRSGLRVGSMPTWALRRLRPELRTCFHTRVPRSPPACLAVHVHTHICVTVLSACGLPCGAAAPLPLPLLTCGSFLQPRLALSRASCLEGLRLCCCRPEILSEF